MDDSFEIWVVEYGFDYEGMYEQQFFRLEKEEEAKALYDSWKEKYNTTGGYYVHIGKVDVI